MGVRPRRRLGAPLKRETVAGIVRGMITDGTLKPGAPAPSGAALARETGYSTLTCRAALETLVKDGTLARGVSPTARLRVAQPPGSGAVDAEALRVALSKALAARRRAAGMTQPELAVKLGVSLTTVGHAETGRLWQARDFWLLADQELGGATCCACSTGTRRPSARRRRNPAIPPSGKTALSRPPCRCCP
jgi:DNA-binding XRE family transcriptional regulator